MQHKHNKLHFGCCTCNNAHRHTGTQTLYTHPHWNPHGYNHTNKSTVTDDVHQMYGVMVHIYACAHKCLHIHTYILNAYLYKHHGLQNLPELYYIVNYFSHITYFKVSKVHGVCWTCNVYRLVCEAHCRLRLAAQIHAWSITVRLVVRTTTSGMVNVIRYLLCMHFKFCGVYICRFGIIKFTDAGHSGVWSNIMERIIYSWIMPFSGHGILPWYLCLLMCCDGLYGVL